MLLKDLKTLWAFEYCFWRLFSPAFSVFPRSSPVKSTTGCIHSWREGDTERTKRARPCRRPNIPETIWISQPTKTRLSSSLIFFLSERDRDNPRCTNRHKYLTWNRYRQTDRAGKDAEVDFSGTRNRIQTRVPLSRKRKSVNPWKNPHICFTGLICCLTSVPPPTWGCLFLLFCLRLLPRHSVLLLNSP